MTYNMSYVASSTDMLVLVQRVNTELMSGWLGVLLLISIGVIVFMSFQWSTRDTKASMAATTFIMFGLGLIMRAMDLIENLPLFIIIFGAAAVIAFTWRRD